MYIRTFNIFLSGFLTKIKRLESRKMCVVVECIEDSFTVLYLI